MDHKGQGMKPVTEAMPHEEIRATESHLDEAERRSRVRKLIRNFLIELVLYGILVTLYTVFVLQYLQEPLHQLSLTNHPIYAFVALGLIIAQAVVLESITSFLINRLGLERLH